MSFIPSPPRPLVLGVDLDGVCADYEGAFRAAVAEMRGIDPSSLPPQTVLDEFSEWGMDAGSFSEFHRRAVVEHRIFRQARPLPGVSEALWALSDLGVWIRIITHRLCVNWAHETAAGDTAAWLDEHQIPYRDLCFIGDKPNVGADVYVEDSPRNVLALRGTGRPVVVYDQPYNRHLPAPRAESWKDVRRFVEELIEGSRRHVPLPFE